MGQVGYTHFRAILNKKLNLDRPTSYNSNIISNIKSRMQKMFTQTENSNQKNPSRMSKHNENVTVECKFLKESELISNRNHTPRAR